MALSQLDRYDPDAVTRRDGQAIVIGAGLAGLSAARVLVDAYESVVVCERDPLEESVAVRAGVPQGAQPHLLLRAGHATAADLFPGITESLLDAGAIELDWTRDLHYFEAGGLVAGGPNRIPLYAASRPVFEAVVRERIHRHPRISIETGSTVTDYVTDDAGSRVTGVTVANGETIDGDLVVDASGRASRTPGWLAETGYAAPTTQSVTVDVTYRSVLVDRPADDRTMIVIPPSPPRTRGGGAFPIEGDRWLITLQGIHGASPPQTVEEFPAFARQLPLDRLHDIIESRMVQSAPVGYPFPGSQWRRFDRLSAIPAGLLVIGDAIASFNPIYGQGMTIGLLEALHLHTHLLTHSEPDPMTFFESVTPTIQNAWRLAVGSDFRFAQTDGDRPPGMGLFNRYLDRLFTQAQNDPELAAWFGQVAMMEQPPERLLHPRVMWRVLRPW